MEPVSSQLKEPGRIGYPEILDPPVSGPYKVPAFLVGMARLVQLEQQIKEVQVAFEAKWKAAYSPRVEPSPAVMAMTMEERLKYMTYVEDYEALHSQVESLASHLVVLRDLYKAYEEKLAKEMFEQVSRTMLWTLNGICQEALQLSDKQWMEQPLEVNFGGK